MPTLDALPPDQRAVLQMVLQGGRTYDEIASLLAIDRAAVRQRALDALDLLGPETSVATLERGLLTDYLLGQLPPRVATQVRDRLAESPTQRAWARVVASELAPLSPGALPEIPAAARRSPEPPRPAPASAPDPVRPPSDEEPRWEEVARSGVAAPAATAAGPSEREPRASRRGGAVLLAIVGLIVVAVIAVVIILVTSNSKSTSGTPSKTSTSAQGTGTGTATSTTGTTTSTGKTQVLNDVKLTSPSGAKSPVGVLVIAKAGTTLGMIIEGTGLAANSTNKKSPNAYAVWLTNTSTHATQFLGFDENAVSSNGRFAISYALKSGINYSNYNELLITLETAEKPTTPGTVVLSGPFSLVHK